MSDEIINKVAESGLVTIDLEKYLPQKGSIAVFDLKEFLFMGMILKEKDFREALKQQVQVSILFRSFALFALPSFYS